MILSPLIHRYLPKSKYKNIYIYLEPVHRRERERTRRGKVRQRSGRGVGRRTRLQRSSRRIDDGHKYGVKTVVILHSTSSPKRCTSRQKLFVSYYHRISVVLHILLQNQRNPASPFEINGSRVDGFENENVTVFSYVDTLYRDFQ